MYKKYIILVTFLLFVICELFAAPSITITSSNLGTKFKGGDVFTFVGFATDPMEGVLKKRAFKWKVNYRHDDHWHDNYAFLRGDSIFEFGISTFGGDASPTVYFTIQATVTALGMGGIVESTTTEVNIYPETSTVTITSSPIGAKFQFGQGSVFTTPSAISSTELYNFSLFNYLDVQTISGIEYTFKNWSTCSTSAGLLFTMTENDQLITMNMEPTSTFTPGLSASCLTNIAVKELENDLDIFPNPVEDVLYFNKNVSDIEIYNIYGQKQNINVEFTQEHTIITTRIFVSGAYFIKYKFNNYFKSKSIIKI